MRYTQTFRPPTWITSIRTPPRLLPQQRSSVSLADLSFLVIVRSSPFAATQLPPAPSPPISPTRQVVNEATPLLDSRPSGSGAPPRRHTVTGVHNHVLGHHRHEPPRHNERHHCDHPRGGLIHYFGDEDREEEVSPASHHHVVDHWQSRHHQSHALGHAHHNGDVECLLEGSDS